MARIGLISDTHGLLRPEAAALLAGSDHLIHGGDIGNPAILEQLAAIAPLTVVRGNNDHAPWAEGIPEATTVDIAGVRIHVLHDISELNEKARADARVVVTGHSHKPLVAEREGVLFVNPGSAGPRRFSLPISVGELIVENGAVCAHILEITPLS
jgi:putative phosphoesterase